MMTSLPWPDVKARQVPEGLTVGIRSTLNGKVVVNGDSQQEDDEFHDVTVGQGLLHEAVCIGAEVESVHWTVRQGGHAVPISGYTIELDVGKVDLVTQEELNTNPLAFVFTEKGPCMVSVQATTNKGAFHMHSLFWVHVPTVDSFTSKTQHVWVGQGMGKFSNTWWIRFVGNKVIPGIIISASVSADRITTAGKVAILQIANNQRQMTDPDNKTWHWSLNGEDVLDSGVTKDVLYQRQIKDLPVRGTAAISVDDAPGFQLGPPMIHAFVGTGDPVVPETYYSYLMFKPNDGMWIPLQVLTWNWEGFTSFDSHTKKWSPVSDGRCSDNPSGVPTTILPTWTKNTSAGEWKVGLND